MFATISITPQELERLALPKHRAELRRFLQILGERQASLLPVDYRGQWIDHLDACVRRLPRGDGVAPSPLKIVERLREAGPVYLETGRWDAAIEQPDEWWGEIEAGYNARSHDAIVGDDATPCPGTLRDTGCVYAAADAAFELARITPKIDLAPSLAEMMKAIIPVVRIHPLIVIENRHANPGHNREFPYVREIILDAIEDPDSAVKRIVICASENGDGESWSRVLVGRLKAELRSRMAGGAFREIEIELRRWPAGVGRMQHLSANRRIFFGATTRRGGFKFRRGMKIDHPVGDDHELPTDDSTTLSVCPASDIAGGRNRLDGTPDELKRRGVEVDLITTADL